MTSVAERLGLPATTPLVIVTADGLGWAHAANAGAERAIDDGAATAAGLMVPAPWARAAAARHRGADVGVMLTVNAEHDLYRWGPITHAPSLLDGDGGFPRTAEDVWDHADVDEVRRECRAQVERAILWGFDVTHLSGHLDTLLLRPEFFDVVLELAVDYRLPMRLPTGGAEDSAGFPFRRLAAEEGITIPDRVIASRTSLRGLLERVVFELTPGVTEIVVRPAMDTAELRAQSTDWADRVDDLDAVCDPQFVHLLERAGAHPIGWRTLRDLQRQISPS